VSLIAGIDVGGTFTDVVLYDTEEGQLRLAKVLTSRNQADGLLRGLRQLGTDLADLIAVVHGTTVATNAVLERKGSQCALVTTRGFRDVLELRRRDRPDTYGLTGTYRPLIPRSRCFEVTERLDHEGKTITGLSADSVQDVAGFLRACGAESVAICLLNSYANPGHERAVAEALGRALPGVPFSVSADIAPEAGEFERASTVAVNAYVRPVMARYLKTVQARLADAGFTEDVQVMQSNGGLMPARRAGELAVRTLLSGPAAGTTAAAHFGAAAGLTDLISCDMGGTSFDVALIPGGTPAMTTEAAVEYGIPIRLPMIDIRTIGAGGGSIAWIDRGGLLRIGPESAGSDPGPACYGRGGQQATVTDANAVLGRINPDRELGTEEGFTIDVEAAAHAVAREIARPLELPVTEAALAIVRVANEKMAGAIRMVSVDKGHDPRRFALLGFGGAGPLHAVELARAIGIRRVVIPPQPGALSAFGCVVADSKHDYVQAVNAPVTDVSAGQVREALEAQRREGIRLLCAERFASSAISVIHHADMAYAKQLYTISVPLGERADGWTAGALTAAFKERYMAMYGDTLRTSPIKLVNLRTTVVGHRSALGLRHAVGRPADAAPPRRPVIFTSGSCDTPVYQRDTLPTGTRLDGPAVIEQADTTTLLPPGSRLLVHPSGALIVEVGA
jgi:N-methylhydantoinase A